MKRVVFMWLLIAALSFEGHCIKTQSIMRYQYFDDYLSHRGYQEWVVIGEAKDSIEGSGSVSDLPSSAELIRYLPYRSGSKMSKKETCCMLGTMAGDKGYHCYVGFYQARIMMRNQNRAHNRKIVFRKNGKVNKSREKLMRTFEKCVATRGKIFHKCCHIAAMNVRDYDKADTQQAMKYQRKKNISI